MKTLLAAILILAIAIALMCVGIIVKGRFPETEVSRNEEMRKRGIKCMKEDDDIIGAGRRAKAGCNGVRSEACEGCGFYKN